MQVHDQKHLPIISASMMYYLTKWWSTYALASLKEMDTHILMLEYVLWDHKPSYLRTTIANNDITCYFCDVFVITQVWDKIVNMDSWLYSGYDILVAILDLGFRSLGLA